MNGISQRGCLPELVGGPPGTLSPTAENPFRNPLRKATAAGLGDLTVRAGEQDDFNALWLTLPTGRASYPAALTEIWSFKMSAFSEILRFRVMKRVAFGEPLLSKT